MPLTATAGHSERVVAFMRGNDKSGVIAIALRHRCGLETFDNARVELPAEARRFTRWRNLFTQEVISGPRLQLREVLAGLPCALLESDGPA